MKNDLEIVSDSVNFENSARGEVHDIFIESVGDGYGIVTKTKRAGYITISGVSIRAVSETFPNSDVAWQISESKQRNTLCRNHNHIHL